MLLVTSLVVAPCAQAAGKDAKERAALKACMAGDYTKGVDLLADLFVDTKNPTYIYNKGRCYEQSSRYADAIGSFREYLRHSANLSDAEKADAERHIADCETILARQERTTSPAATVPPTPMLPQPVVTPEPPTAATASAATAQAKPAEPETAPAVAPAKLPEALSPVAPAAVVEPLTGPAPTTGKGLRIAGITCGAIGLASIGTAIYFYARATSMSDKVSNATTWKSSDNQAGKDAETMQWVFYSVGAGAVVAGVVLYLLGWPASTKPAAVAPLVGPGTAGISAQGAF